MLGFLYTSLICLFASAICFLAYFTGNFPNWAFEKIGDNAPIGFYALFFIPSVIFLLLAIRRKQLEDRGIKKRSIPGWVKFILSNEIAYNELLHELEQDEQETKPEILVPDEVAQKHEVEEANKTAAEEALKPTLDLSNIGADVEQPEAQQVPVHSAAEVAQMASVTQSVQPVDIPPASIPIFKKKNTIPVPNTQELPKIESPAIPVTDNTLLTKNSNSNEDANTESSVEETADAAALEQKNEQKEPDASDTATASKKEKTKKKPFDAVVSVLNKANVSNSLYSIGSKKDGAVCAIAGKNKDWLIFDCENGKAKSTAVYYNELEASKAFVAKVRERMVQS